MIRRFKLEQARQQDQQSQARPRSDSIRSTKSFEQSPVVRNISSNTPRQPPGSPLVLGTPGQAPSQERGPAKKTRARAKPGRTARTATIRPRKPLYKPKQSVQEPVPEPESKSTQDESEPEEPEADEATPEDQDQESEPSSDSAPEDDQEAEDDQAEADDDSDSSDAEE